MGHTVCVKLFLTKKPSITLIYMTCKRIILFGIRFIWSKWSLTIRKRYFRRKNYMVTKKSVSKELINRVFGDKWLYSLSPARTFALDSVNHKEQQHNITIRVSMRRRRSRIGRQGGNRMAAVFNLVMATLRVGEIHYNLSTTLSNT